MTPCRLVIECPVNGWAGVPEAGRQREIFVAGGMEPGDARWLLVSRGELALTEDEIAAGWHFCSEFDEDLCKGDENGEGKRCQWCDYEPDEYQGF